MVVVRNSSYMRFLPVIVWNRYGELVLNLHCASPQEVDDYLGEATIAALDSEDARVKAAEEVAERGSSFLKRSQQSSGDQVNWRHRKWHRKESWQGGCNVHNQEILTVPIKPRTTSRIWHVGVISCG